MQFLDKYLNGLIEIWLETVYSFQNEFFLISHFIHIHKICRRIFQWILFKLFAFLIDLLLAQAVSFGPLRE